MMLQAQMTDGQYAPAAVATFKESFHAFNNSLWYIANGWSDGTWMLNDWRSGQIKTGPNGLAITFAKNPSAVRGYSSGEVQSRGVFGYGYFEAKMTVARGAGLDTGFFLYTGPPYGRPWNEIDVEFLGKNTRQVQVTYHNGNQQVATVVNLPFDAASQAHRIGFDWQPSYIRWYVDGYMVHQETGAKLPLPNEPQKLFFNLWGSTSSWMTSWLGNFNAGAAPFTATVSCFAMSSRFTGTLC